MPFERSIYIVFVLLAVAGFCLPAYASDWDEELPAKGKTKKESDKSRKKLVLQGQVSHAERLPALGDNLQAGASFNPSALPRAKYDSSWFKIPVWFAGTFQSSASTIDFIKDYATGQTSRPDKTIATNAQETHGIQPDAQGGIWHYYTKAGSSKSEQAGQTTFNNIDWYGPEYVSDDKVVMRILATSFIVDSHSGIIVDSFRREDLKTYEPVALGITKVTYTSKSFDSHGLPRDLQDGHSEYRLVQQFQPCNNEGNLDYRQMFKDFLSTENMPELIPR